MVFTNFEKSSFKEVSVKKNASTILKKTTELVWLGQSRQFFPSKTVNDLTEIIIKSHRRLIIVRRFTIVQ